MATEIFRNALEQMPSPEETQAVELLARVDKLRQRGDFLQAQNIIKENPVVQAMFEARQNVLAKGAKQAGNSDVKKERSNETREKSPQALIEHWNNIPWEKGGDWESQFKSFAKSNGWEVEAGLGGWSALVRDPNQENSPMYVFPYLARDPVLYVRELFDIVKGSGSKRLISPAKVTWLEQGKGMSYQTQVDMIKSGYGRMSDSFTVLEKGRID